MRSEAEPALDAPAGMHVGSCILCASRETRPHWSRDLVQCAACSLVRAADRFFQIDPRQLYGASYYSGPSGEYVDYQGERRAVRRNSRRRMKLLQELAPRSRRLFEIGCGYGYFLGMAAERWSASGIEMSAHAAEEAQRQGLPCASGEYLSTPGPDPRPDIVCMWDTIEHLTAPRQVLEKIAVDLAPGGLLALSTGDIGGLLPRLQRHRWRLIHPPTHLWYFSAETLTKLLDRTGFTVVRIVHPVFYRSVRFCLRPIAPCIPTRVGDWPVPMQTGDLMEIYARPIDRGAAGRQPPLGR
jgi:SAM-dependent methyltransferase